MGNIANISEHPEVLLLFSFIFKFGFYFISKNYFGTWGRLFIRVLQQSSCMMPLKATCKILTIKLILKALLNHFFLILLGLLFKTFQSAFLPAFLLYGLSQCLAIEEFCSPSYFHVFILWRPLLGMYTHTSSLDFFFFLLVLLQKYFFFPCLQGFSTFNSDSELHQADTVKEEQWVFVIYQSFRTWKNWSWFRSKPNLSGTFAQGQTQLSASQSPACEHTTWRVRFVLQISSFDLEDDLEHVSNRPFFSSMDQCSKQLKNVEPMSLCKKVSSRFTEWILKSHMGKENPSLPSSEVTWPRELWSSKNKKKHPIEKYGLSLGKKTRRCFTVFDWILVTELKHKVSCRSRSCAAHVHNKVTPGVPMLHHAHGEVSLEQGKI